MNILKEIKELIHKYPNDQKLGNVVRHNYRDKELYEDQGDGHLIEIDSHLIYESPDNGNTFYSREFGKEERHLLSQEEWICQYCKKSTYYVDLDYIGSNTNHLSCELEHEISHDVDTEIDLDRDIP